MILEKAITELVISHGFSKSNAKIALKLYDEHKELENKELKDNEYDFLDKVINRQKIIVSYDVINGLNYKISTQLNKKPLVS